MPGSAAYDPELRRHIVLIADSNPLIAMDLAATIGSWGATPRLIDGLDDISLLPALPSLLAAIVDVSLPEEGRMSLLEALRDHNVPTALTTTFGKSISDRFPGFTVFDKPIDFAALRTWFKDI